MPGPSRLLRLESSSLDFVSLGAARTTVLPCEENVFQQGLELLWKRALKEGGHGNLKKKIAVNQHHLDKLQKRPGVISQGWCT